ncbi:MAG: multiple sugar transport system substrate-binding protein [Actinomycetota bacterium]|nr:multiple sugar transport system substrate-binding protein [Actinomycetota bacterium]MDQ1294668.1 multiple sugar transport system substrate-binding protein [Actinomycetota bacterium]
MANGAVGWTKNHGHRSGRRRWILFGTVGLVGALIVPLGVRWWPREAEHRPVEIVILAGEDRSGARKDKIDHWNRVHGAKDGWKARLVSLSASSDEQRVETAARLTAGEQVDLVVMDVTQTSEFARAGHLRRMTGVDTSGFMAGPLETCRYEGKLWALPLNTDAGLMFYNRQMLRTLTKRTPQDKSSVEQSLETDSLAATIGQIASMLNRNDSAQQPVAEAAFAGQFADYEGYTVTMLELLRSQKVQLDGDAFELDSAVGAVAMDTVTDVLSKGKVLSLDASDFTEAAATAAFVDERVVLMRNWPVAYRALKDEAQDRGQKIEDWVGVAPVKNGVLGGQNIAVTRRSENPEAAKSLAEFLTGETSQEKLFEKGGFAATRESVYSDSDIRQKYPYADKLLTAVKDARPRPATPYYWHFSSVFRQIVQCARAGEGKLPEKTGELLDRAREGRITEFRCEI